MKYPKHAELWLSSYLRDRCEHLFRRTPAKRLWVAITDHFEPLAGGRVSKEAGWARIAEWERRWPEVASLAPKDSCGQAPCFTFFYPQEDYQQEVLSALARLSRTGIIDVEVHIHHSDDSAASFMRKMTDFTTRLYHDHGFLHWYKGRIVFGFIHGNWALDNSLPDGRHCGVTGELRLLRDLGCYADFTMPSVPSPTQSRIVNQIYWTNGDPTKPRGYDRGTIARVGGGVQGDLLMIPGPLGIRFRSRLIPRIETGELAVYDPPTQERVKRWLELAPRIGDDIFLKLFGHSAREDNATALLGTDDCPGTLGPMFEALAQLSREQDLELHWCSAFQMYQAIDGLIRQTAFQDHDHPI